MSTNGRAFQKATTIKKEFEPILLQFLCRINVLQRVELANIILSEIFWFSRYNSHGTENLIHGCYI